MTHEEVADSLGFRKAIALPPGAISRSTRGVGFAALLPVCFERSGLFGCAVIAGGAVFINDSHWQPLLSAGGRLGGEFPVGSPVRVRGAVQLLGGLVRPATDSFWQASPVQLGVMAGLVADAF